MPSSPRRAFWLPALVFCTATAGLVAGTAIGARYFVPPGSGLAGPPATLGYGVVAAIIAATLAVVLGRRLSAARLRASAVVAFLLVAATAAFLVERLAAVREARRADAGLDAPLPPPSDLRLESHIAEAYKARSYRDLRLDGTAWRVAWGAPGPEAAACAAVLTAAEAEAVLRAVAALEASLGATPQPCAGEAAPLTHGIRWRHGDGASPQSAEGGTECLQIAGPWQSLVFVLGRIPIDAVSSGRARCSLVPE